MSLLKRSGGRVSASFESNALFVAAATGNVNHLALLTDAASNTTIENYDKVNSMAPSGRPPRLHAALTPAHQH